MTDKILKEAFDKLTAIEEGAFDDQYGNTTNRGPSHTTPYREVDPNGHEAQRYKELTKDMPKKKPEVREAGVSVQQGEDIMDGIEEFTDIQDRLFEIIEELTDAIRAYAPRSASYWSSHGLAQLKIIAGSDEYASHDKSINSLINDLKAEAGSADDDYDERM